MSERPVCGLCGEPMPEGEEMFKYHGYSGPCPKPPLPRKPALRDVAQKLVSLFVWEQSEETGEVVPHLDREIPHLYDVLTEIRDALADGR